MFAAKVLDEHELYVRFCLFLVIGYCKDTKNIGMSTFFYIKNLPHIPIVYQLEEALDVVLDIRGVG